MDRANSRSSRSQRKTSNSWCLSAITVWACPRSRRTRSSARSLPRNFMGPAWGCPSAAPSLNRIAADYGLPTTLRGAQVFTSFSPPESRHMIPRFADHDYPAREAGTDQAHFRRRERRTHPRVWRTWRRISREIGHEARTIGYDASGNIRRKLAATETRSAGQLPGSTEVASAGRRPDRSHRLGHTEGQSTDARED